MILRRQHALLAAFAAVSVVLAPTALAVARTPVLGGRHAFPNGQGFGKAHPRTVYLGGDPTGEVSSMTWRHWGQRRAVGFGRRCVPDSPSLPAMHASHLYTSTTSVPAVVGGRTGCWRSTSAGARRRDGCRVSSLAACLRPVSGAVARGRNRAVTAALTVNEMWPSAQGRARKGPAPVGTSSARCPFGSPGR
jgi:hypothetical protein